MIAGPAMAADMPLKAPPPVPYYDWSGYYIGFSIGGVWGEHHRLYFNPFGALGTQDVGRWNFNDAIIDVHGGVQRQFGSWVVGVEASVSAGAREMSSSSGVLNRIFAGLQANQKINTLVTAGVRLGYAWDRWLVYGTGGWAQANLSGSYTLAGVTVFPAFSDASTNPGWYAGGGAEYMLAKGSLADVIVGVEYQHFDLSARNQFVISPDPTAFSFSGDARGDIVRARLSIKWNPWTEGAVVAKY
jgi:outer membrane immunogenic protein